MHVCILSIGSELLEGSVVDTNSAFISSQLARYGATPKMIRMVHDNRQELISLFLQLSNEYDVILTTGGLGPTFDDITAECLSASANLPQKFNEKAYLHLTEKLNKSKVLIRKEHKNQCMLPKGCNLYNNNHGTALGFSIVLNRAEIICMPGVPIEMKDMFVSEIMPKLVKDFNLTEICMVDLNFISIAESEIDAVIRKLNIENIECIINASAGKVVVKLRGNDALAVENIASQIESSFPNNFAGRNIINLSEIVISLLKEQGKTISFAESCTGGLVSKMVTDTSGASAVFYGGIVSYDNSIKENLLKVGVNTLNVFGAVSHECALEMAFGVKNLMKTDYGVSITGIAGPNGDTKTKEVGLVYIAITDGERIEVIKNNFTGNREQIRQKSANKALITIINFLNKQGKKNA